MSTGHWHERQWHEWHWNGDHWVIVPAALPAEIQVFELEIETSQEICLEGPLKTVEFNLELDKAPEFPLEVEVSQEVADLELHKVVEQDLDLHKNLEVSLER